MVETILLVVTGLLIIGLVKVGKSVYDGLNKSLDLNFRFSEGVLQERGGKAISFKKGLQKFGAPFIKVTINNKRYTFLIDTGATMNYISSRVVNEWMSDGEQFEVIGFADIQTADSESEGLPIINLNFEYKNFNYSSDFTVFTLNQQFESATGTNETIVIDGIIGNPFMESEGWDISFKKRVVWIK